MLWAGGSASALGHDMEASSTQAKRCVALTFDDGPSAQLTPKILKILREHHVHATFFLVGKRAQAHPNVVRAIVADGNAIGNHSWSHPFMAHLSESAQKHQILRTNVLLEKIVPGYHVDLFRPPYGSVNQSLRNILDRNGMVLVWWNVDDQDYLKRTPKQLRHTVFDEIENDSIILMHDIHANTVEALPAELNELQNRGYRVCSLEHMIEKKERRDPHWQARQQRYGAHPPLLELPGRPVLTRTSPAQLLQLMKKARFPYLNQPAYLKEIALRNGPRGRTASSASFPH